MGQSERSVWEARGLCRGRQLSWLGVLSDLHCEREEFSLSATDAICGFYSLNICVLQMSLCLM